MSDPNLPGPQQLQSAVVVVAWLRLSNPQAQVTCKVVYTCVDAYLLIFFICVSQVFAYTHLHAVVIMGHVSS